MPNHGAYCRACLQSVPESQAEYVQWVYQGESFTERLHIGKFYQAFAEVFGVSIKTAREYRIRPSATIMAMQVMANEMKRNKATYEARRKP